MTDAVRALVDAAGAVSRRVERLDPDTYSIADDAIFALDRAKKAVFEEDAARRNVVEVEIPQGDTCTECRLCVTSLEDGADCNAPECPDAAQYLDGVKRPQWCKERYGYAGKK